jgi:hypothetical protein
LLQWVNQKAQLSKWPGIGSRAVFLIIALVLSLAQIFKQKHMIDLGIDRAIQGAIDLTKASACNASVVRAVDVALDHAHKTAISGDLERALCQVLTLDLARELGIELTKHDLEYDWSFASTTVASLLKYIAANKLVVECLQLSAVSDRGNIEARLLLPALAQS